MSNVPGQGPLDVDATIMVPAPAGRRAAGAGPVAAASAFAEASPVELDALGGLNGLVASANALLLTIPRIRKTAMHPDPAGLRDELLRQIAVFEKNAGARGYDSNQVLVARYAMCTLIDEAVSGTPWGGTAEWARASLLVTLHRETFGGEKFFQILNKLAAEPARNLDLLEFMYVCLAFGFEGRFRLIENGRQQLEQLREKLAQIIQGARGAFDADLALHWRGEDVPTRRGVSLLPLWVSGLVVLAALLGVFVWFSFSLNDASDQLAFGRVKLMPPPRPVAAAPAPPPVRTLPTLAGFLQKEIAEGLVAVRDEAGRSHVVIRGDGLFDSGRATVRDQYLPILLRIAEALNQVPGQVLVTGHTDNQPSRSVRFPSNWHLSQARAEAVALLIAPKLTDPARIKPDGRSDQEPVAGNDTPEGRAVNRRVEILLRLAG